MHYIQKIVCWVAALLTTNQTTPCMDCTTFRHADHKLEVAILWLYHYLTNLSILFYNGSRCVLGVTLAHASGDGFG